MTPLFFPYTFLSAEEAALAAHFFHHLTLYQPVSGCEPDELLPWIRDNFIHIRVPVPDDDETIVAAAEDYQAWARSHGQKTGFKTILPRALTPRPPFFNENAPAQILKELKGTGSGAADDTPRLFNARLFLYLAQHLDQHRQEIGHRLNQVEADANALMDKLNPAEGSGSFSRLTSAAEQSDDASDFMAAERLKAWTQLFLADQSEEAFLLTTSLQLFKDFVGSIEPARLLATLNAAQWPASGTPAAEDHREVLLTEIREALTRPLPVEHPTAGFPGREEGFADLILYLLPATCLKSHLAKMADLSYPDRTVRHTAGNGSGNVIIGFLNPDGTGGKSGLKLPQ